MPTEDLALVSHLLRRAGFGASRTEVENYAQKDDLPRNWIVSDKNLIRASKSRLGELKKGKNKNDQRLEVFESYVKSLCLE